MTAADFNNDGHADLAAVTWDVDQEAITENFVVLLGNGDGTLQGAQSSSMGNHRLVDVVADDFDGDANMDVAMAALPEASAVVVALGNGDGTFQDAALYPTGAAPSSLVVDDFDNDGVLDVAAATGRRVAILLGAGDGTFIDAVKYRPSADWLTNVDLNEDGHSDLAVANSNNRRVAILLGTATGTFEDATTYFLPRWWVGTESIAAGDLNGNGHLDLLVGGNDDILKLMGFGDGSLGKPIQVKPTASFERAATAGGRSLIAEDVNDDGILDVVGARLARAVGVNVGRGKGRFADAATYRVARFPTDIAVADFNEDGKSDLASTNSGPGSVSVLLNQSNMALSTETTVSVPRVTRYRIFIRGTLTPPHVGHHMQLELFQRIDGHWVLEASPRARVSANGIFRQDVHDRSGRCKIVATFAGDEDHEPSRAQEVFRCAVGSVE